MKRKRHGTDEVIRRLREAEAMEAADQTIVQNNYGSSLGLGELSLDPHSSVGGLGIRKGYAGYEHDGVDHTVCHVRHRVLLTELGRWTRRDPLGYVDGMGLYEYVMSAPFVMYDPSGRGGKRTDPKPPRTPDDDQGDGWPDDLGDDGGNGDDPSAEDCEGNRNLTRVFVDQALQDCPEDQIVCR